MSGSTSHSSHSTAAKLAGATCGGLASVVATHALDTSVKRLQKNSHPMWQLGWRQGIANVDRVIFSGASGAMMRVASLHKGLIQNMQYKVFQGGYRFGAPPILKQAIRERWQLDAATTGLLAGMAAGVGECTLPGLMHLDRNKIEKQTGGAGRSLLATLGDAFLKPQQAYQGWSITAMRNCMGSGSLWAVDAITGPALASAVSIIVSTPADTIRTRVMLGEGNARQVLAKLLREEGVSALFKGLGPKFPMLAFKLWAGMRLARYFTEQYSQTVEPVAAKLDPKEVYGLFGWRLRHTLQQDDKPTSKKVDVPPVKVSRP